MELKQTIIGRIEKIKAAEKITREELAALSREMLTYVWDTADIDMVNRLIGVLTPVNTKVAVLFFGTFLPHEDEKDEKGVHIRFGKRIAKEKALSRRKKDTEDFLGNPDNTIWTWQHDNLKVEKKPKDYAGQLTKDVKAALKGNNETDPLNPTEIVMAVLNGGISVADLLESVKIQHDIEAMMAGKDPEVEPAAEVKGE